jgi:hypothetical protein
VIRQGYPSIRQTETETDLRMRGWVLDIYPPQPRFRRESGPFQEGDRCVPAGSPKKRSREKATEHFRTSFLFPLSSFLFYLSSFIFYQSSPQV